MIKKKKYKKYDWIYPNENGTDNILKKNRWDLILETNKEGKPTYKVFFYNIEVVRLFELLIEMGIIIPNEEKKNGW